MRSVVFAFGLLAAILQTCGASAQELLLSSIVPKADPVGAADSDYGRAMVQEVARIFATTTDAPCRQTHALDDEALRKQVRDLFIQHGHMWNAYIGRSIDDAIFAKEFEIRAGESALREWRQLLGHPVSQRFAAIQRPIRNMQMMGEVAEFIRRFGILNRVRFKGWDEALIDSADLERAAKHDEQAVAKATEDFMRSQTDPRAKRYVELSEVHAAALLESQKKGLTSLYSIGNIFPGIGERLKALCIPIVVRP
jgi:hypothetical protein